MAVASLALTPAAEVEYAEGHTLLAIAAQRSPLRGGGRRNDAAAESTLPKANRSCVEGLPSELPSANEAAEELADATARARLIAEIGRLIREPKVPEATRVAGLTLIGWLARRRPEEPAHAVGVAEARKSR